MALCLDLCGRGGEVEWITAAPRLGERGGEDMVRVRESERAGREMDGSVPMCVHTLLFPLSLCRARAWDSSAILMG